MNRPKPDAALDGDRRVAVRPRAVPELAVDVQFPAERTTVGDEGARVHGPGDHLLILQELAHARPRGGVIVKGGVNLRPFFESPRYSEDMDLDGHPDGSAEIRRCHPAVRRSGLHTTVQAFGIRGLDPGQGPNKDTQTTFRYKVGVIGGGGVRYPTKVDASFREHDAANEVVAEAPPQAILDAYGLEGFVVHPYALNAAVRQKIQALAGRREAQARDVFDLCVLAPDAPSGALLDFLSATLSSDQLHEARTRSLAISFDEYRGQVREFLEEPERERQGTENAWDEMRLRAAALIDAILDQRGRE